MADVHNWPNSARRSPPCYRPSNPNGLTSGVDRLVPDVFVPEHLVSMPPKSSQADVRDLRNQWQSVLAAAKMAPPRSRLRHDGERAK